MTVLAASIVAASLVTVALTVSLCAGLIRSQQRAAARERDLLLNQILHLAGRPWQPSPADTWTPPVDPDAAENGWPTWAGADEQAPVY